MFDPLFAVNQSFNIGLLPDKKLYLFVDTNFWMQRPGAGITNPSQGNFDFSKREFDVNSGMPGITQGHGRRGFRFTH